MTVPKIAVSSVFPQQNAVILQVKVISPRAMIRPGKAVGRVYCAAYDMSKAPQDVGDVI
eukprot:CAMPEP_0182432198 /NCGR_PEP_ID=MMETSP1167-20130531/54799_1 /TAXON_ID=2988 /ORGANISM="Mallomonas Sp, Strain CCMP3275" /LENGTH=58 /DNA_ID=CAMNT_0024619421 /DNA_START=62 /DNA_END=235 /DNA_ORIENTATION=-